MTNHGLIELDDRDARVADLVIDGDSTLEGRGKVRFNSIDDNRIISNHPNDVLTIGAQQELVTSSEAVAGASASRIVAAVDNRGTISADGGGLRLDTNPKINNGLMRAINGGPLEVNGTEVANATGVILAGGASVVRLVNPTIDSSIEIADEIAGFARVRNSL